MNNLANESSLYLRQHAQNPVNWFPWGDQALTKAKKEDKPILVSIGYSSCHWCHVMERESFESEEVAEFLNEHFVSIKVDREERPDLDHIYMEALQTISGQGGWPLNMFLTPDQKPFYGGTYFPPKPLYGRPSFLQVLHKMHEVFIEQRVELEKKANQLVEAIATDFTKHLSSQAIESIDVATSIQQIKTHFEPEFGGFSSAPKFPQPMILDALLRISSENESPEAKQMLFKTLDEMGKGGIYDHVGGGFHRYSTDREWLAPHFEKMLYDNALLLSTYSQAFRFTKDPFYYTIAEGIYTCLERDFKLESGGYGSAWDADSEDEEGKFYVWNPTELKELIGNDEWIRFTELVDYDERGNWENQLIIRLNRKPNAKEQEFLKSIWTKLFDYRRKREHPVKDSKNVLAWNGLAMLGLYEWYLVTLDDSIKHKIISFVDYEIKKKNESGHYHRVDGIKAFCDDLASFGLSLIRAFQLTGNEVYLKEAELVSDQLREEFYSIDLNSFSLASKNQSIIHNPKDTFDNSVPSANALCVQFLNELGHFIDDNNLKHIARLVTEHLVSVIAKYPTSCSKHLWNALSLKSGFQELVLVGDEDKELLNCVSESYISNLLVVELETESVRSSNLLIKDKFKVDGKATAYLCKNFSCELPVTKSSDLKKGLKK